LRATRPELLPKFRASGKSMHKTGAQNRADLQHVHALLVISH
jgi:hypothetical protein